MHGSVRAFSVRGAAAEAAGWNSGEQAALPTALEASRLSLSLCNKSQLCSLIRGDFRDALCNPSASVWSEKKLL